MQLGLESFFNEKDVFIESGDFTFFFTPLAVARAQMAEIGQSLTCKTTQLIVLFVCFDIQ